MRLSTRLTLAMVALVLLTAAAIGFLTYRSVETVILPGELERVDKDARTLARELESYLRRARADIVGFRAAVALGGLVRADLAGGVDPRDGTPAARWRDGLAARFVAELGAKPEYSMFRLIGVAEGGRELVRIDRYGAAGAIRRVPESQLGRRGEKEYFRRTIGLAPEQVYVSDIGLGHKRARIRMPREPVLRVATPVYASDPRASGSTTGPATSAS